MPLKMVFKGKQTAENAAFRLWLALVLAPQKNPGRFISGSCQANPDPEPYFSFEVAGFRFF
jgi:hypothetical protein